jgi:threonine synthase
MAFACARRNELPQVDHVMARVLGANGESVVDANLVGDIDASSDNPFVRYRQRLLLWHRAASDTAYVDTVGRLDERVATVAGVGFRVTPASWSEGLRCVVKDETGNVSGSHKGRHLMGIALALDLACVPGEASLAIASCGNAALAAAVVARAAQRPLHVFVPPWADRSILADLSELGATITTCERRGGDPPGDPCHHRFRDAVASGAIPFSCQGPDNGLALEGGRTLGYELLEQLSALRASRLRFDESEPAPIRAARLFVQVGGGALASSLGQALLEQGALEDTSHLPVSLYAVQTEGCAPLARAWQTLRTKGETVARARTHRDSVMWPWEQEPHSVASGIIDDETYDWAAVLDAVEATEGDVVVASEDDLRRANELARASTAIDVDHTGSAGLAGLLASRPADDVLGVVVFTGRRRATQHAWRAGNTPRDSMT